MISNELLTMGVSTLGGFYLKYLSTQAQYRHEQFMDLMGSQKSADKVDGGEGKYVRRFIVVVMNKKTIFTVILLLLFLLVSCNPNKKQTSKSVWDYVPHEINGWTAVDSVEVYNRDNIFDYLDGGAEIYLKNGLTNLSVIQFHNTKQGNITVELYNMGNEKGAYTIFSALHEDIQLGVGEQYEYQAGSLCFWKEDLYICIIADRGEDTYKSAIFNLAKYISGKIL